MIELSDRDSVDVPVEYVTEGMVGPGGMVVESITPEEGTRIRIAFDSIVCHVDPAQGHVLTFPVRPVRPEALAADPLMFRTPAERAEWFREIEQSSPWYLWSTED